MNLRRTVLTALPGAVRLWPELLPTCPATSKFSGCCNSDLAAVQNCTRTHLPLLAQNPRGFHHSRFRQLSLAGIQPCLLTCQVWVAQTWLSFHADRVYRTNCQGNTTHWPIQRKKNRWNGFLGTAISGYPVAFSFDKLNKECLCCTGNLVSLHEWTSQLLISFVPETKIWLPWLLSACWSNIHNHFHNYIANHFLTGCRITGKYFWLGQ